MKLLLTSLLLISSIQIFATEKDSTINYDLPDSVTAVSFIADIQVASVGKKESFAGIKAKGISLVLEADKKEREVSFEFPSSASIISTGINVKKDKNELEWAFDWKQGTTYKLLLASASDSAENFVLYSAYIFLPEPQKWKLIGTCRIHGEREGIRQPAAFFSNGSKSNVKAAINNIWVQRAAGSWEKLNDQSSVSVRPVTNPLPNVDSVQQYQLDKQIIEQAITSGKSDATQTIEGVYYKIVNTGSGKSFTVADSITVHYQLRIFGTSEVISGSYTESYTFPLKVLIKAWQVAVPLIKTGGKIKLLIPSGLGYSIRTRAPKIPPNSILEFDVEVLDSKPSAK